MAIITTSAKLTASSEPSSGVTEGQIYYNSTTKVAYIWNGTLWKALNAAPQADLNASVGILSTALSCYKIHIFLLAHTGNTWTPTVSGDIDYLVVSGGGGGGAAGCPPDDILMSVKYEVIWETTDIPDVGYPW